MRFTLKSNGSNEPEYVSRGGTRQYAIRQQQYKKRQAWLLAVDGHIVRTKLRSYDIAMQIARRMDSGGRSSRYDELFEQLERQDAERKSAERDQSVIDSTFRTRRSIYGNKSVNAPAHRVSGGGIETNRRRH